MNYKNIITLEAGKRSGKPCIRGLRMTIYNVLDMLANRMSSEEIIDDFSELMLTDIQTCLAYAADREQNQLIIS
ncbi:DUF433 domain-containing protein [Candidatus Albibeggiatoa sp. nov. BB20]|uniref:DUF433 domain-containing protein n=1 Tax=Candidatus Albibeggiatoa sp. nov. BB20 TaxID=3162723 RepID=UPI0033653319